MKFSSLQSSLSKLVLLTTVISSGIVFFGTSAVTIAIPRIQTEFGATIGDLQWVINSYTLVLAVMLLISGALSDKFGRKKSLLFGLSLFAFGSFLSGIADSVNFLIAARAVQGFGGAFMIPQSLAIINSSYSEKIRGQVIGIWGGASGVMSIFGPFAGGWIVDTFGWPYLFFLMIPIIGAIFLMTLKFISETETRRDASRLDLVGIGLFALGLTLVAYPLVQVSDVGWGNVWLRVSMLLGVLLLGVFIYWEKRVKYPLVNLKIFSRRHIVIASVFTLLLYTTISSVPFFLTIYLQQLKGLSATLAGFAMLPLAGSITVLTFFTGKLVDKYGAKWPMFAGAFVTSLGIMWMGVSDADTSFLFTTVPGLLLMGVGFAVFIPALTKTALSVDEKHSGIASGVNNAISRVAGLLGIALISAVVVSFFTVNLQEGLASENVSREVAENVTSQSGKLLQIEVEGDDELVRRVVDSAFLESYRLQLFICAGISLAGALLALLLKKEKGRTT